MTIFIRALTGCRHRKQKKQEKLMMRLGTDDSQKEPLSERILISSPSYHELVFSHRDYSKVPSMYLLT